MLKGGSCSFLAEVQRVFLSGGSQPPVTPEGWSDSDRSYLAGLVSFILDFFISILLANEGQSIIKYVSWVSEE